MTHSLSKPEPLGPGHATDSFDCGNKELNEWLRRFALVTQGSSGARVVVVHRNNVVVGFYALAAGSVAFEDAPRRVQKGLAKHPIPVILLARFGVDKSEQRKGLGSALLKDALKRAVSASETIGARAVLVHAKEEEARSFYERFDFEPSPTNPLHLMLLMKDLKPLIR